MYFILVNSFLVSNNHIGGIDINSNVDIKVAVIVILRLMELLSEPMGVDHRWTTDKRTPLGKAWRQSSNSGTGSRICAFNQTWPVVFEPFLSVISICNAMEGVHPVPYQTLRHSVCGVITHGPSKFSESWHTALPSGDYEDHLVFHRPMVCCGFSIPSFLLTHLSVLRTFSSLPEGLGFGFSPFPACLMDHLLPGHGEYYKYLS